jgi:hypothetical protein
MTKTTTKGRNLKARLMQRRTGTQRDSEEAQIIIISFLPLLVLAVLVVLLPVLALGAAAAAVAHLRP